jgi:hypothetical protein
MRVMNRENDKVKENALAYLSDQLLVSKNLLRIREYLIKNFGNNKTKTIIL